MVRLLSSSARKVVGENAFARVFVAAKGNVVLDSLRAVCPAPAPL